MKLIAAVAFLALIVAFAAAESSSESQCRREMQQRSLDRCRSFMKHGRQQQGLLMTGVEDGINDEDEDEMMAPQECCQQLRQTSERCRCPMIRQMMRKMQQEEGFEGRECRGHCGEMMMMRGRFLPAMCGMEPHTCRMRQGRGY